MYNGIKSSELLVAANQFNRERDYWLNQLFGELVRSHVPYDYLHTGFIHGQMKSVEFSFPGELQEKLLKLSNKSDAQLHMIFVAVMVVLLHKYTGNKDIVIGTPIYKQELERNFTNTILALRIPIKDRMSFKELLLQVRQIIIKGVENQSFPIELLVEKLNIPAAGSDNDFPLFDAAVMVENIHDKKYLQYVHLNMICSFLRSDIEAVAEGPISGLIEYSAVLYQMTTIENVVSHFIRLVGELTSKIDTPIDHIDILTDMEKTHLLMDFNQTETCYPRDKTIHELFEVQAAKTPGHIAVGFEDTCLTYEELNKRVNQLAAVLRLRVIFRNVNEETIVAVMIEHSIDLIIGILGILKAGGAYLPIDPGYPEARKKYIVNDSGTSVLLIQHTLMKKNKHLLSFFAPENILPVDDKIFYPGEVDDEKKNIPEAPSNSRGLAYIIYTSGSTGYPKGVAIEHQALVNYTWWAAKHYVGNKRVNFPLYTTISFDLTVTSIFTPLITGNAVIIYGGEFKEFLVEKIVKENRVDAMKLTPSHLKLLREHPGKICSGIKRFIVGGEDFETNLARDIVAKISECEPIEMINEYGPTEATVGCMIYLFNPEMDKRKSVPIGNSADNVQIYILDERGKPVLSGASGELYVSGDGVARGYLNRPGLTHERFRENPFNPGKPMYRTGDLARRLTDGNIEFLGRIDQQVKIRGFRIELDEIKTKLLNYHRRTSSMENQLNTMNTTDLNNNNMVRCSRCLLSSHYPNIHFDKKGVCSVCQEYDGYREAANNYFKEKEDFYWIVKMAKREKRGTYDCLLLFSGGKDSSYVLYQLIDMGLTVLTFTFDNGFISEGAFRNIKRITSYLNVENIIVKAKNMNNVFIRSLESHHNVCHGCWNALNTFGAKIAYENGIPVVISGLSRGQILDMRLHGLFQMGIFDEREIEKKLLLFRKTFHSKDNKFLKLLDVELPEDVVEQIHFVDYFKYINTSVKDIKDYLLNRGWVHPGDTGFCSSNCIINDVGIYVHLKKNGYHFYESPLSWDCRLGQNTREELLNELKFEFDLKDVKRILNEIGYFVPPIDDAVVVDREDKNGNKYLCAYVVSRSKSNETLDLSELRNFLAKQLPDYMIPTHLIPIDRVPLTHNGKVDKRKLPEPQVRSGKEYDPEPPGNEIEELLREVWQKVLGVKSIGINDNFFQLGGDSINVIQVSAALRNDGFQLDVNDIFLNPTIKEMAPWVKQINRIIDHHPVEGTTQFTPIQKRFFDHSFTDSHYFNQSVMIYKRDGFDEGIVKKVFAKIMEHHDALRIVFKEKDREIFQWNQGLHPGGKGFDLEIVDLKDTDNINIKNQIEREANKIQGQIRLDSGPLVKLGLFKTYQGDHLLMVIHHLVVDGISWRILLEDFTIGYQQTQEGKKIIFPGKTDSYQYWASRLMEYSRSKTALAELSYWKQVEQAKIEQLPKDHEIEKVQKKYKNRESFYMDLDEKETEKLLKEVNKAYNTEINDILIATLARTIHQWGSIEKVLIAMEGHGREDIFDQVDINRTVGWFTSLFPVVLDMTHTSTNDLSRDIKQVKETLRKVPNKGIGYGILRYLTSLQEKDGFVFGLEPEINFNYLGQFSHELTQAHHQRLFELSGMEAGKTLSPEMERPNTFDFSIMVLEGKLRLSLSYNTYEYEIGTIESLLNCFKSNLIAIIDHCVNKESPELTLSDISSSSMDEEELEAALDELEEEFL